MQPDYILKADVLDIIFENKNKQYGAYTLRKFYHERLYKSLAIIFTFAATLALIGFFYKNKTVIDNAIPEIFGSTVILPDDIPQSPQPPKQPQKPARSALSAMGEKPKVVADPEVTDPIVSTTAAIVNMGAQTITDGGSPGDDPGESGGGLPSTNTGYVEPVKLIDKNTPVASPDVMPVYPGGMEALRKFLQKNLVNPNDIEQGETISVKIKFIVGYDGSLKGFDIVEDGGNAFNNEVIRVLKKMPLWIPGKAHGENVSVIYCIPVKFTSTE